MMRGFVLLQRKMLLLLQQQMEWSKRQTLQQSVAKLRVKDIRNLFAIMRRNKDALDPDSLFPAYGLTVGEFSTAYVVNTAQRKELK
jgi:hypothetical protein